MNMLRNFEAKLEAWEREKQPEPLLVTGARQVGKTWLIQHFCEKAYSDCAYFNFETNPALASVFDGALDPGTILRQLGALRAKPIGIDTVIILDEIQRCEKAITALKYFCETRENYRVIGAGSLLGVKLNRFEGSFPVGKVRIEQMYPMTFDEFLQASGEALLLEEIETAFRETKQMPLPLHEKACHLYQDYLFVGGMPQCVLNYLDNGKDANLFHRDLQQYILLAYAADMGKYTTSAAESAKITAVYNSIPRQLARENPKFSYKEVRSGANQRDFHMPIDWLLSSGMIYQVNRCSIPQSPLAVYTEPNIFKTYLSDSGLLCKASEVRLSDLLPQSNHMFKGAITENYVMQTLAAAGKKLYYFKPDATMEIDLLLEGKKSIIPIEIKSGRHKRSRSLINYQEKYHPEFMVRLSENNFGSMDHLLSIPLYATHLLPNLC